MMTDELYMRRCLELAIRGQGHVAPNPMVGSVLVYKDRIIGEGYHQLYGQPHAEVNCIYSVKNEDRHLIPDATIYVSLEPCAHFGKTPPCADLIIRNNIKKVVVGCRDPFEAVNGKGIEKLLAAGIDVQMSSIEKECIFFNRRFFTFHKKKRPYIILKWAQTLDGSIAYANQEKEERLFISNNIANREVHKWRHDEAAILVGTQTAMLDNPSLTNRQWKGKSPIRLVIDKHGKIPLNYKIFNDEADTVIFSYQENYKNETTTQIQLSSQKDDLTQIMDYCYQNNIQSILVEGGKQLLQSFLDKNIWDEARLITNENLIIQNGLKAPSFNNNIKATEHYNLDDNKIDIIHHSDPHEL
ncbi:MAG: bifunctional diaminohydroxyphosphoribosylaminopyrimidine deaminase/5-amino-6-(5-phosphoribosylamino)uracil reductase RibD [Pseudopedobacter saltans]|uniref:Riboflavin biosynthesis protein RibD n=1 Tax=Pseudopedobacter saltans TaxID=151895 RepID=A0A2W5GTP7_9SPHI|nr:MAG: bifunctional diaminohydroxyphosphoribosylaminopyrimidine deaminase/5-amino-6-(5-phosphoribosylamino)uracil reductase RibD [Pseudopedobacter saltans]